MTPGFNSALWWLRDRIFPTAQPLSKAEKEADFERREAQRRTWESRAASLPAKEEHLIRYLTVCKTALDDERQRQQSTDTRLTTIIGLASIAGTIVFGTLLTKMPETTPIVPAWLILLSVWYMILQLTCAIYAAVRGLERRDYNAMSMPELLPSGDESSTYHCRRQIEQFFGILAQHQDQNNAKVTQMAVAHCAVKNFVGGLVVFALLVSVQHLITPPTGGKSDCSKMNHTQSGPSRSPKGQLATPGATGPSGAEASPETRLGASAPVKP